MTSAAACCAWRASTRRTSRRRARRRWPRCTRGSAPRSPARHAAGACGSTSGGGRARVPARGRLRRLPRRAAGRRQPRAAVHRRGAPGVLQQRLRRAALRAAAARRGAGLPDRAGRPARGRQRLALPRRPRRRSSSSSGGRCGASTLLRGDDALVLPVRERDLPARPGVVPDRPAGAAAGVRGVAHVAVALDRRPARRDGRGALVRLAHAADVRGPARGPVRVPLGDGVPRASTPTRGGRRSARSGSAGPRSRRASARS